MNKVISVAFAAACFLLLATGAALAAGKTPVNKLHISFDLEKSALRGTSTLEVPADQGAVYHTPGLLITSITINGREVDLSDRSQAYFADPDHELTVAPGPEPTTIKLTYELHLGATGSPVGDLISPEGISLTNVWHPILHQDQIFELTAEIPRKFEAISEAEDISTTTDEDKKIVSFSLGYPQSGINFIAAPFIVEKVPFGDNRVLYTYFFEEDRELADVYRQKALGYLARYEKQIGPFPYKRFSVVENRLPTGYSMPTFTVLGQTVVRLPFITETSLGHEILHQWFGNSVQPEPAGGNWAEGLTTMLADARYSIEKGEGADFRKNQLIRYHSFVHGDNQLRLLDFVGAQSHLIRGGEDIRAIGYGKASMFFHMLQNWIGEDKFTEGLRDFYSRFKYQRADWQSLRGSFEKVTGTSLEDFFSRWLTGTDLPLLQITDFSLKSEEGRPVMRFKLVQGNKAEEPYLLKVPLTVTTDSETVNRTIDMDKKEVEVEIPFSSTPRELVIDENYDLLRYLAASEYPHVWSRFVGAENRLAILDKEENREKFSPLIEHLQSIGCRVIPAEDATTKDISTNSVIFLGLSASASRKLFATPNHPESGVTFDIRANPLNPSMSAVLVSGANQEEVLLATRKINHYGKYSYLHFEGGRAVDKRITETQNGQRFTVDPPPDGIKISDKLSFDDIIGQLAGRKVVYLGESHTRYEDHLLQIRMIRAMYHQNPKLAIGMEMFSHEDQEALDSYVLEQSIDEEEFLRRSSYMVKWSYDYRFYQPIIDFARRNRIPVIALNLDRNIVSKVYRETGIDGLADEELAAIPEELDISMPDYRNRIGSIFQLHEDKKEEADKLNQFLQAQSLWDETMAETIADYLAENPEYRMAVVAGLGHVNKKNAIPPRVARRTGELEQAVVLNAGQFDLDEETADYLVFSAPVQLPPPPLMGISLKEENGMILVDKISPHGMAGKSGIKEGDIILSLDDKPVDSLNELKVIMFYKKKGESVAVGLKRKHRLWPDSLLTIEVPL